ncbi:MAG: hypothetical protein L6Q98_25090, partial [Anaerolineae bacterium]|nr:hypothetical protein [Anaerolineae bacterium]
MFRTLLLSRALSCLSSLALMLLVCAVPAITSADPAPQVPQLRYVRQISETQKEYVRLTLDERSVTAIPPRPDCMRFSPTGDQVGVVSSAENTLTILDGLTFQPILSTPWLPEWEHCFFRLRGDSFLSVVKNPDLNDPLRYDFSSGSLVSIEHFPSPPPIPPLPEQYTFQTSYNFVIDSPRPDTFLYVRCFGEYFGTSGYQHCPGGALPVIYNAAQGAYALLPDTLVEDVSGHNSATGQLAFNTARTAWSFDGRYLAHAHVAYGLLNFNLAIFDVDNSTDLKMPPEISFNERIKYEMPFAWSPIGYKLLFWVIEGWGTDPVPEDAGRFSPVILDYPTLTFTTSDQLFLMPENPYATQWAWSPDGSRFVFVDRAGNLTQVDAQTGVSTVLDTQVTEVIAWVMVPALSDLTGTITLPSRT